MPLYRATTYAEARLAADADDSAALALLDLCETLWAEVAVRGDFVEREIGELADERVAALLADADLAEYANHVRRVRAAAATQPPAELATTLARLDPTAGWERLARQLLGRITVRRRGEELSLGAALPGLYDQDRDQRGAAVAAITEALTPEVDLRASALGLLTQARLARDAVSGVTDWCTWERQNNQLGHGELAALLDAVRAHRPLVHRYYQAKADLLGHPLTDADRYAPLGSPPDAVSWAEACEVVLTAFARLGGEVAAQAHQLIAGGAVDALPRPGKRRGALTFGLPGGDAWVLVNFTGRPRDVLTLAHELGHAVHTRLAGGHGPFNAAVPTALAETVGLFTESLAGEVYAELATEPGTRTALLARQVEDQLVAAFRQVALHDFEDGLHRVVRAGEVPDHDELGELWLREQAALYGPAVTLSAGYRHWWSYLDNLFLAPGSRFAYAYGQLAASALLASHHEDPAAFRVRFENLLRAGASAPPAVLLRPLDPRRPDPDDPDGWHAGLAALHEHVAAFVRHAAPASPVLGG
ncbi:M3 family metallopeptidase [Goodfellowiella coeruleoviolacea]|uniref:M3 family metallopeptidase n=1 Tax=Goodfellowiella coeruleoviolacea TaxID=334858 RepID=UPI000AF080F1|nr:M3 family metallopeptidase [Goodfellowiella coeruleoviolacea]